MSQTTSVRLVLWGDAWPAVYPADATLERVPWTTRPEHVASRAQGLAAQAIAVLPPRGMDASAALAALRRHTSLPLWLIGPGVPLPAALAADLEPFHVLRDLEPRAVKALAEAARQAPKAGPERGEPRTDPLVAVFAPAGGAGASTLAAALGRTLAAWRLPTVLLDLNLHAPTLSVLLRTWSGGEAGATLEQYLRNPTLAPVPVGGQPGLGLVPGLEALENLDEVTVGAVVALLEHLRGSARVVDTAPVVTDPAVYASLRSATHTVLVADDRVPSRLQLKRYRRLFLQLGLGWREALLVINHPRPAGAGPTADQIEEEVGLKPLTALPYAAAVASADGPPRAVAAWRAGVELLAATVLGRPAPTAGGRWRGGSRHGR